MKTYEIKFKVSVSNEENENAVVELLHKLAFEMETEYDFVNQVAEEKGCLEAIEELYTVSIKECGTDKELFVTDKLFENDFHDE